MEAAAWKEEEMMRELSLEGESVDANFEHEEEWNTASVDMPEEAAPLQEQPEVNEQLPVVLPQVPPSAMQWNMNMPMQAPQMMPP